MHPSEPDPLTARMDALTEANQRLLRRITELEQRVARLEGHPPPAEPGPESVRTPAPEPAGAPDPEPAPAPALAEAAPPPPAAVSAGTAGTAETAETAVGLTWANRAGALTLIIGAAFFFKYAVDNAWIGPAGRVLLGLITGAALTGWSLRLRARGQWLYGQGVAGAGVTVLYLAFWAAHALYQLVPAWLSFAALAADTVLAGALAVRFGAPALAGLGLLGGYLTPPLLATGEVRPWLFFSFLFAVNAGWLTVARRRSWLWMEWMALPLTLLFGFAAIERVHGEQRELIHTYAVLTQWAVFVWSPARFVPALAQLIASFWLGEAWRGKSLAGFSAFSLPLAAAGLAAALRWEASGLAGMALLGFFAGFSVLSPGGMWAPLAVLMAGFALLQAWLPLRLALGRPARREDLVIPLSNAAFAALMGYGLLTPGGEAWRGLYVAGLGAVYLACAAWVRPRLHPDEQQRRTATALLAGIALTLLTASAAVQLEGFRITLVWALEAAGLAWLTTRIESRLLRIAALAAGGIALLRLLGIDAALHDPLREPRLVFNVRFLTAAVTAAGLAGAAWWLRPRIWALPPWVGAHVALLAGLAMEVVAHATRTAAEGEARSAQLVSLSVLMAIYGLALVAGGVATRTRVNRVLGLGLLALVMLKLYFADVWAMARIHRVVAFIALGALLLAASFLYSRFRDKVEALLQDERQ